MTGEELKQANDTFTESLSISADSADVIANGYMTAGQLCTQKFVDGLWVEIPVEPTDQVAAQIGENLANSAEWERMPDAIKEQILNASQSVADSMAEDEEGGMAAVGTNMATQQTDSYVLAMEESQETITAATTAMTDNIKNTIDTNLGTAEGAPSTVTMEQGKSVAKGIGEGIKTETDASTLPATRDMTSKITNTLQSELSKSKFEPIGRNVSAGIAAGIRAGIDDAVAAATELASAVEGATKGSLKIESPSKVFKEIGAYCVAGFAEGMDSGVMSQVMSRNVQGSLDNMVANISVPEGGGYSQTINVYAKAQTPDELAREIRLETKYGPMED